MLAHQSAIPEARRIASKIAKLPVMRGPKKQPRGSERLKLQKGDKPQAKANKHVASQIRKILGKHYASKYRVQSRHGH